MALFNGTKREINAKIVYFGPPAAGKAATIQFVHRKLKGEIRSPIKAMGGQKDRMLFFDFMPPELGEVNGFRIRFHLYTVQGDVSSASTWKTILKGTDGIVFVADASRGGGSTNGEYLQRLREYLSAYGQELAAIPYTVQCNKSDLADAASPNAILQELGLTDCPAVASSVVTGEGILQVLSSVLKQVIGTLRESPPAAEELRSTLTASEPSAGGGGAEVAAPTVMADFVPPMVSPESVELTASGPVLEENHEPELELFGEPAVIADGCVEIPLKVMSGDRTKLFRLTVSLNEVLPGEEQR